MTSATTRTLSDDQQRLRTWLNAIMVTRRLSSHDIAEILGVKHTTVKAYRAGFRGLPPDSAETLQAWYESPNGHVPQRLGAKR